MTRRGRITDVERVAGSVRARRIWVDDAPFRVTSAAVIAAVSVAVGDEVDVDELAAQCDKAERTAARDRALRLLSYHDFSTMQMARRLAEDGYPPQVVTETVSRLTESGLLDDARFAETHARSRLRSGYGARVVRRDLARAGIPEQTIDDALDAAVSDSAADDALAAGRRLVRPSDDVRRLAARLARRGFDAASAFRAAREVLGDRSDDAEDTLFDG